MKVLSNKEYEELQNKIEIKNNKINELDTKQKETNMFWEHKLDSVYYDLLELKNALKGNISKEEIKIKVQDIMIKIYGK